MNRELTAARTEREKLRLENKRLQGRVQKVRDRAKAAEEELEALRGSRAFRAATSASRVAGRARKISPK